MAIHPEVIAEAQYKARYHLQVEIAPSCRAIDAEYGNNLVGNLRVRSIVRRLFRGDQKLSVGDTLTFIVPICDKVLDGPCSIHPEDFDEADFMEVFLDGEPPDCKMVEDCFYVIKELTPEPIVIVNTDLVREVQLRRERIRESSSEAKLAIEGYKKDAVSKKKRLHKWDREEHKWIK